MNARGYNDHEPFSNKQGPGYESGMARKEGVLENIDSLSQIPVSSIRVRRHPEMLEK
ncbi:MAG: hypothetical protein K0R28_575 [Paenibacillus sp.]|nr:hypothetical protein [Paenibacillus sp.]